MTPETTMERISRFLESNCPHLTQVELRDPSECCEWMRYAKEVRTAIQTEREWCAKEAETFYDFGPSTQCPDCGSEDQVLHWYELGKKDAATAIRKGPQ